jgi:hypothetical protein
VQPVVLINHQRNTALLVAWGNEKQRVIKLGKGRLTVSSLSAKEIEAQGYTVSDYPPELAAREYLRHGAGVSKRAKRALEEIAYGKFSGILIPI